MTVARMSLARLTLLYGSFAILAIVANLLVQRAVLGFGDNAVVFAVAVGAGTLTGLVLKYVLDKRWIFADFSTGIASHGRKFGLYATMGISTTLIFWGTETAFWLIWRSDAMRELGAVLGLVVGYVVKYWLDSRFVFVSATAAVGTR